MKRSVLTLFSGENDVLSHVLRLALTEKGIAFDVEYISDNPTPSTPSNRFAAANATLKKKKATIVDRDLKIDDITIALEYLDDKFPHPPLLPTGPEKRAKTRIVTKLLEKRIFPHLDKLNSHDGELVYSAVEEITTFIVQISGIIDERNLMIFDEEFSVLDCLLGPVLYKLFRSSVDLRSFKIPTKVANYYRRLHNREQFLKSLQLAPSRGFMYEKGK
ncbi:hypothetical protein [Psittacicella gerlachiana]|uniref:GST N-terminal domain-containing protein n=1 Tax=Psittacicella gerlachiana TaxID=2028574 RepID=A0A3A1Y5W3_9GAMM|nr:hypothetical protein [Psittacicella gerlachiana]RIY31587.1 hypothetical protein CKF59_07540 [Psittacicella gerlachiana]